MIWPASTPYSLSLPLIPTTTVDFATDPEQDDKIVAVEISKLGYVIVAITWRGIYLFRLKPLCPVAVYIRSKASIESYGANSTLFIRPDGQMVAVTTEQSTVLTFQISSPLDPPEVCRFGHSFSLSQGHESEVEHNAFPGPGEGIGVREVHLRMRMIIRVDSGISHAIALDDNLMIVTKSPRAIQTIRWTFRESESPSSSAVKSRTKTLLLSQLEWLDSNDGEIVFFTKSKAMSIFSFVTESGSVYTATLSETDNTEDNLVFEGHNIHKSSGKARRDDEAAVSALNARFSVVALGCKRGTVYIYNIKDYLGNVKLIRVIDPPASSLGRLQILKWSSDGNSLFAGYERGWALYSVYGMLNASSFLSNHDQKEKEPWLGGIKMCIWSFNGDSVFMVPNDCSRIWVLSMLKWNASVDFAQDNLQRPILYTDSQLMLYSGQEQSDLTTIDRDALLWLHVPLPASYISDNWPMRFVSSSTDGKYIAVSGIRGLAHYSLYSGRWKLFSEDYMDREFTVKGGLLWYGHIIIAGVDTEYSHEIRMYSRDLDLDPQNLLYSAEFPATILKICLFGDKLLVYTHDNMLYFYRIVQENEISGLELEREISFTGIVQSPARVRALSCLNTRKGAKNMHLEKKVRDVSHLAILVLVDGMLVLLQPSPEYDQSNKGEITYKKRILHNYIEYYTVTLSENNDHYVLWAFDGKEILVWLKDILGEKDELLVTVPVESYPLAILVDKGIVMGIESDVVLPREANFTYFKYGTSTQLFVPYILESYLRMGQEDKALSVVKDYVHLKYFEHILEMLLYRILDSEATKEEHSGSTRSLLTKTTRMLSQFPQMLDIILGCTRKTELSYWKLLFDVVGSPQDLFQRCIQLAKLKTAAGYLLVLHSLDRLDQNFENTKTLFELAYNARDWDLCKDLARFLTAVDPSHKILIQLVDSVGISLNSQITT